MYQGGGYTRPEREVAIMFYKTVWSIASKVQTIQVALENTASDLLLALQRFKKKMIKKSWIEFCFPENTSCIIKCSIIVSIKRKLFYILSHLGF